MGAVVNMAPDDYEVIVTHVPFVDVVTTMLDETIPLTSNEWDEWGDPREPEAYDYMLSSSAHGPVEAKASPAMFVGTSLWASPVQSCETAKWVAHCTGTGTAGPHTRCRPNMEGGTAGR